MIKFNILILIAFNIVLIKSDEPSCTPHGVKLNLGDSFDKSFDHLKEKTNNSHKHDYTITYFTQKNCTENKIHIKSANKKTKRNIIIPKMTRFYQPKDTSGILGTETRTQDHQSFIYEYQIDSKKLELPLDSEIEYSCIYHSDDGEVLKKHFKFYHHDYSKLNQREFKLAWIADYDININPEHNNRKFGLENMQIMDKYINQDRKKYVAILGGGDYSYDMNDDNGQKGEEFQKASEFSYANIPFLSVAGNHEEWYNFTYYKNYFRNPSYSITGSDYYTVNLGELLLVGIDINKFVKNEKNQNIGLDKPYFEIFFKWFDDTLTDMKANYRWIVVFSHQNLYCFEDYPQGSCYKNPKLFAELEDLLVKHQVDIFLAGHVHAYERVHPFYKGEIQFKETDLCQMKKCSVYESPKAPVYVVDGVGGSYHFFKNDKGCNHVNYINVNIYHLQNLIIDPGSNITVTSDRTIGFSTFTVKNSTHLEFEHITSETFSVFDSFTIIKPLNSNANSQNENDSSSNENEINNKNENGNNYDSYIQIFIILLIVIGIGAAVFIWQKYRSNTGFSQLEEFQQQKDIECTYGSN